MCATHLLIVVVHKFFGLDKLGINQGKEISILGSPDAKHDLEHNSCITSTYYQLVVAKPKLKLL